MTPTIRELVEPWHEDMTALDNAWGSASWRIATAYTESVEMLLNHIWGIDGAWLSWFLWDKPKGRGKAIVDGVEWNIVTLDDLIEMLNSIANPGGGK